jgi:4-diphosphocytidyl-2-C-methyl-D-erythritol kinase
MQTLGADFARTEASLAPAKINLTLRISGRRADGFHELESLVAFAPFGDRLTFSPDGPLDLDVSGPMADGAGPLADNLVLRAARTLDERIEGLRLGRFALHKELPSGAGLGGGSADAAAALRLIAKANGISFDDPRVHDAARATGADIPVCLDPRPRVMRGIGEILSAPATLPPLGILIVHPGFALPTGPVFKALGLAPGQLYAGTSPRQAAPGAAPWQGAACGGGSSCSHGSRPSATTLNRPRLRLRRRSPTCLASLPASPAAGSPACQARGRHASACSTMEKRRQPPQSRSERRSRPGGCGPAPWARRVGNGGPGVSNLIAAQTRRAHHGRFAGHGGAGAM